MTSWVRVEENQPQVKEKKKNENENGKKNVRDSGANVSFVLEDKLPSTIDICF